MKVLFKSKVDRFYIFLIFTPIVLGVFIVLYSANWILGLIILLLSFLLINILLGTNYSLIDNNLLVRHGLFFNKTIDIQSIKKIGNSISWDKAPALSMDRLEIKYNEKPAVRYNFYDSVIISPKNKEGFIEALLKINPQIAIV